MNIPSYETWIKKTSVRHFSREPELQKLDETVQKYHATQGDRTGAARDIFQALASWKLKTPDWRGTVNRISVNALRTRHEAIAELEKELRDLFSPFSGIPEVMAACSRKAVCSHREFHQGHNLIIPKLWNRKPNKKSPSWAKGLCAGLVISWMKSVADGTSDVFLDNLTSLDTSVFKPVRNFQGYQDRPTLWAEEIKLTYDPHTRPRSAGPKYPNLGTTLHDTDPVVHRKFNVTSRESLEDLVLWFRAASDMRYFFVSTEVHAMAAVGSRTACLQFFDPNGGVVQTWSTTQMKNFLYEYFNHEAIKGPYKLDEGLFVEKYTRAST